MSVSLTTDATEELRLILCGDVMLGRGIDQLLPHPGEPRLHEHWRNIYDAREFIKRAETKNNPLPENRSADYVWGEALDIFARLDADLRLINLETAITTFAHPWPNKRIHFRMHPKNIEVLKRAQIDCCALANNHSMDWGHPGLRQTLKTLSEGKIAYAGAGQNNEQAGAPKILSIKGKGRVLFVSAAEASSGVPRDWAALDKTPGVNLIELNDSGLEHLQEHITKFRQTGDIVVVSLHWGSNYGHLINNAQRSFAKRLIDELDVHVIRSLLTSRSCDRGPRRKVDLVWLWRPDQRL